MQLYLRTLGVTELDTADGTVPLSTREAALLAYVCRKPLMRATRAELIALFWPGTSEKNARHSLSQLLYALRTRIPEAPLAVDSELVAVSGLDVDLLAATRDVASGFQSAALARYKGRFLPNDDLNSEKFRDWRDRVEEDIAFTVSAVLQEQSHICSRGDLEGIISLSELILSVHPHMTSSQIALIEATARTGQFAKAERLYTDIVKDVDLAVGLPPLSSFLARSAAAPETHLAPFSGRDDELNILLGCWDKAIAGEGQVVVLMGEPGIGKTRLADQLLRRVAIRGGAVWIANCCAATQRLPYSVVNELIREHIKSPSVLSIIKEFASPEQTTHRSTDEYRHRLTDELTCYVINQAKTQPLAILVDDAQWTDEYTALLIAYWAYRLRSEQVMLILTTRTHEAEPPPDWILSDLGLPIRLSLGRIGVAAAENIVAAFERNHTIVLDRAVKDAVLWQSGGRPFLLLEALASLLSDGAPSRPPNVVLSEPAESMLLRRFHNLPPDANRIVGILAVWGRPMPRSTLQSMSGLSDDAFASALNVLHARGIAHLHEGAVSFPHDLMRETAYRSVLPATRVLFHTRAAAELSMMAGPVGLIAQHYALAGDANAAGEHALRAADAALTSHSYSDFEFYCKMCIDAGMPRQQRTAALGLARHFVQIGRGAELSELLPLFADNNGEHKTFSSISQLEQELASGNRSVTDLLGHTKAIIAEAQAAEDPSRAALAATLFDVAFDACAGELDYHAVVGTSNDEAGLQAEPELQMESVLSVWHGVTRDVKVGLSTAKAILDRMPDAASPTTRAICQSSYATLLLLSGNVCEARMQFKTALDLAYDSGDLRRQLSICINNGVALMEAGEMNEARHSLEKAVTSPNVHFRIRSYTNLAMLHYEEGNNTLAGQAAQAVLAMNASYESPSLGSISHAILGLIALRRGDYEIAKNCFNRIDELPWSCLDDVSYTAAFQSQMLLAWGRVEDAIALLEAVVEKTKMRDVLCTMRLQCELASILARTQPDGAYRLARTVEMDAAALGALNIRSRASRIRRSITS